MPIKMKVCNAADYNGFLKERGRIFHYFEEATKVWLNKPGTKFTYSDRLIEILAIFRYLLKFPYRQLEGLLIDYLLSKNIALPVPNYSTLCRRMAKISSKIIDRRSQHQVKSDESFDVLLDSTGINIYCTGGGHSKENATRRKFKAYDQVRKMHVAYTPKNKRIDAMLMSTGTTPDFKAAPPLLKGLSYGIKGVYADSAYDRKVVRAACVEQGAKQIIPPQRIAVIRKPEKDDHPNLWQDRNAALSVIKKHKDWPSGLKRWKEKSSYGKRSLIEAQFSRFKAIFGFHFMSRSEQSRACELMTKVSILNSFSEIGCAKFARVE